MITLRQRGVDLRAIATGAANLSLLLFIAYPLFLLLLVSFGAREGFTVVSYLKVFAQRQNYVALGNSLYVGTTTTLLATLIGVGLAWLIARTDLPLKRVFPGLIFLTFVTPPYIGTIGWIQLFGRAGYGNALLTRVLGLSIELYSLEGIIAVMALYLYPLVFWATAHALERTDPTLEDAAASSGGTRWRVLTTITLPLVLPSILSAAALVFINTLASFGPAAALGLPARHYVLTTRIYAALSHYDVQMAAALSVILVLCSGGALLLQNSLLGRRRFITTTSGSRKPEPFRLGRWRLPIAIVLVVFFSFTAVLPLLTLLFTSLLKGWGLPLALENFTLGNYLTIFQDRLIGRALRNSLIFATLAASAATLLGFLVAYISARTKLRGRGLLDLLATFPRAIPRPVLAMAMILAFMNPPLALYNTPWIVIVAYIVAFTPLALRVLSGSLRALDPVLEEAAWASGASWLRGLKDMVLPLLRPGILTSFILVFLRGLPEIPLSLMLHTRGTETVGVVLFFLRDTVGVEAVSALAVIVILITLAGHLVVGKLGGRPEVGR